jgi:hypothetical protein
MQPFKTRPAIKGAGFVLHRRRKRRLWQKKFAGAVAIFPAVRG